MAKGVGKVLIWAFAIDKRRNAVAVCRADITAAARKDSFASFAQSIRAGGAGYISNDDITIAKINSSIRHRFLYGILPAPHYTKRTFFKIDLKGHIRFVGPALRGCKIDATDKNERVQHC